MAYELKHYDYWPASQAARIALLELGITATITVIDMAKQAQNDPAFQALTPYGAPPVLIDTGHVHSNVPMQLWDPVGICEYTNHYKPTGATAILPVDPCERPVGYEWAVWAQRQLIVPLEVYLQNTRLLPVTKRDAAAAQRAADELAAALSKLEAWVPVVSGGNRYLANLPDDVNGVFSLADILVGAATQMLNKVYPALFPSGTYPKTVAYNNMLAQRASWQTAFANVAS